MAHHSLGVFSKWWDSHRHGLVGTNVKTNHLIVQLQLVLTSSLLSEKAVSTQLILSNYPPKKQWPLPKLNAFCTPASPAKPGNSKSVAITAVMIASFWLLTPPDIQTQAQVICQLVNDMASKEMSKIGGIGGNNQRNIWNSSSGNYSLAYLIYVISFTQAGFLNPEFLHQKTMKTPKNYNKYPPKRVKYAVFFRSIWKNLYRTEFLDALASVRPMLEIN